MIRALEKKVYGLLLGMIIQRKNINLSSYSEMQEV
jgi:hypothetical protein